MRDGFGSGLVECGAGRWLVEAADAGTFEAVAGCLTAAGPEGEDVCGRVLLERDGGRDRGRVSVAEYERSGRTVRAGTGAFSFRVEFGEGRAEARVRVREGREAEGLRTVLRLLGMWSVFEAGGMALHASSVSTGSGVLVFPGRSGAGKSSAAGKFPAGDRLDDDVVLLGRRGGMWVRLPGPDTVFGGGGPDGAAPVKAVCAPSGRGVFRARRLRGAAAAARCVHAVPGAAGAEGMGDVLARAADLAAAVPVLAFEWMLEDPLPVLLEEALLKTEGRAG